MKKYSVIVLVMLFCIISVACSKNGQGTYYPDCTEMRNNLEVGGYKVSVTNDVDDGMTKTCLSAEKGEDYIVFYWLDKDMDVESVETELKNEYLIFDQFVSIQNDSKFGSLVFCGTNNAVNDSGIVIVDAK